MSSQVTIILERILSAGVTLGARGIHLTSGARPLIRHGRGLEMLPEEEIVTPSFIQEVVATILDREAQRALSEKQNAATVMSVSGMRFKVNIYYQKGSLALSLRPLATRLTPLQQLNLPYDNVLKQWLQRARGLIIICGPIGSGRSTVASALLQSINQQRSLRIITLEDPIEVLFTNQKSIIEQREVGSDVGSWQAGIESCLEEDADVVYLSDVPTREVATGALRLASAGHLVVCSLNARDTIDALDMWASLYSVDQLLTVRNELATHLVGVLALRLLPKVGGGEILAYEVLSASKALANTLRNSDEWPDARSILATAGEQSILFLDHVLADLVKRGLVSEDDARMECITVEEFNSMLKKK